MTIKASGPGPNPNPLSFSEIEAEFGSGGGQRRLGKYRSSDPAFQNEGPFGNSADNGMLGTRPLDTGVPTSGTIAMEDLQGKSLNVIVDYHSGSADEGGTRPEDARTRYNSGSGSGKWTVIGGYKTPPSDSGGTKVKINVNKGIGGQASASETAKSSLRTGTWDTNTMLSVDMGS